MITETVAISDLHLDPVNVRKHDKANLKAIKASLARFGQQKPIVIDSQNVVRAGNGTLAAATELGWTEISVVRSDLNGLDLAAYAIADNRTAELADWDMEGLAAQLKEMDEELRDIAFEGFEFKEEPEDGNTDDDAVPEKADTRCKPGDLWLLGNHRLLCGDSTNVQHVERLMGGEKADMVYTDPPYGVNERTSRGKAGRSKLAKSYDFSPVIGDDSTDSAIDSYNLCESLNIPLMIFWGANYFCRSLPEISSWIIWDKREGKGQDDNADCELAWSNRGGPARIFSHLWKGAIKASEHGEKRIHPTQKPVALDECCIKEYPKKEVKTVLDLFLGSGSTLIACEKTKRECFGMEIDPHYCDVILKRWEDFTGLKAELLCE